MPTTSGWAEGLTTGLTLQPSESPKTVARFCQISHAWCRNPSTPTGVTLFVALTFSNTSSVITLVGQTSLMVSALPSDGQDLAKATL